MSTEIADVAIARSIRNPVLTGFHPDPSILRVDDDYYLATSTFEWYPGVRVHHSKDLVHWRELGGIITERRLLDLRGCGDSNGIWAPDLTYHDGLFHLVYSDVASFASGYWDAQNFLTTAPTITGPWSDPVRLHSHGFDAALFHDDDGTSWLLAMSADWRPGRDRFGGIEIQQYDPARRQLVGRPRIIFTGTDVGLTEDHTSTGTTAGTGWSPPRAAPAGSTRSLSRGRATCSDRTRWTRPDRCSPRSAGRT
ncbi:hypothetical protein GCM10029963_26000 [Micromonospora andamanensis]